MEKEKSASEIKWNAGLTEGNRRGYELVGRARRVVEEGEKIKKGFGRDERRPMAARHDAEFPHAVSHHVCFSTASYDL